MSKKVPENIRSAVWELVYQKADEHRYLEKDRRANGQFMENLEKDQQVGGRLLDFMSKSDVKRYIKDAIINRYSKERRALPKDIDKYLAPALGNNIVQIEYIAKDQISLHRLDRGALVAVARTTYVKWETGLKKILLYLAGCPGLNRKDGEKVEMALVIFHPGAPINSGEKATVAKALEFAKIKCFWEC